ncbi:hypothetical protein FOXB_03324, partial [Fusarium oxysporum f. sp. conglutinans Fo5176]
IYISPKL